MSDALSTIGSAAVTTVGTVAVAGAAMKAVSKATGGMGRGGRRGTRKSGTHKVFSGTRKSKSFSVWN